MPSQPTANAKLGLILRTSQDIMDTIIPYLNTSIEDPIQKRSIIKKIIILAEILSYIRNSQNQEHPLLKPIYELKSMPGNVESILDDLNIHRNKLAHHYLIEHLMKNENRFIEAINFCNSNLTTLNKLITDLNLKLTPKDFDEDIIKIIGQIPEDKSDNSALDYLCYSLEEISQLENILKANNTSMQDTQSLKQFLKTDNYVKNPFLKEAILNAVENILTFLKLSNRNFKKEKLLETKNMLLADKNNSVGMLSKGELLLIRQSLPDHLTLLLTKANIARRDSIHNWNNLISNNVLKELIINISQLKMKYLDLIISHLNKVGFLFKDNLINSLSTLSINIPPISSSSSMLETSDQLRRQTLQREAHGSTTSREDVSFGSVPMVSTKRKQADLGISDSTPKEVEPVEIDEKTGLPFRKATSRTDDWDKFNKKYKPQSSYTTASESSEGANQPSNEKEEEEQDVDKPPQSPNRPGQS
jgi:hypothetical protein